MNEAEYRDELNRLEEQLTDLYRQRRALTAEFAADHPYRLPPARARSEVQQRVARCPRCGGRLSDDVGTKI